MLHSGNQQQPTSPLRETALLFGGSSFLQVPHLERVVLRGGDEDGLHRVERQSADAVKVAPQGELGVPRLSHGVCVVADLRERGRGRLVRAAHPFPTSRHWGAAAKLGGRFQTAIQI